MTDQIIHPPATAVMPPQRAPLGALSARPGHRALLPCLLLAGVFAIWTVLVTQGVLSGVDHAVARGALRLNGRSLDQLTAIGSSLFSVAGTILLTLAVAVYTAPQRCPRLLLVLLLALLAGGLAERGIRAMLLQPTSPVVRAESFQRAAPESVVPAAPVQRISVPALGVPDARHSYPSGHLTLAAVLCVSVALIPLPGWRSLAVYAAMLLLFAWGGWSEIYRGTHLFSDVAGALFLGAAVMLLCRAAVDRIAHAARTRHLHWITIRRTP